MNTSLNIMGNYNMFGEAKPNEWLLKGIPHNTETFWLYVECNGGSGGEIEAALFFERLTTTEVDAFTDSAYEAIHSLSEWNAARKVAESEDAES
jgi:hypothetical protein